MKFIVNIVGLILLFFLSTCLVLTYKPIFEKKSQRLFDNSGLQNFQVVVVKNGVPDLISFSKVEEIAKYSRNSFPIYLSDADCNRLRISYKQITDDDGNLAITLRNRAENKIFQYSVTRNGLTPWIEERYIVNRSVVFWVGLVFFGLLSYGILLIYMNVSRR